MGRFKEYLDYLRTTVLIIPFMAVVGDYLVRGLLRVGLADEETPPTFTDAVLACHSLSVLYVMGAMVLSRSFRGSQTGKSLIGTVVVLSAVRLSAAPPGRSPFDALGYVGRFVATEGAILSDREYAVADSLGWHGRPMMWAVSAHARTKNMFVLETEKYNAMLHCTWQCH